jgi:hypothetical protein
MREKTMTDEKSPPPHDRHGRAGVRDNGMLGSIYGMAFIGAAIYFIQHATTFWGGVLGFLEALVWPAVLMYKLLEFLKM